MSDRQDLSVLQREYADDDTVYQLKIKVSETTLPAATRQSCCRYVLLHLKHHILLFGVVLFSVLLQDLYKKYSYIRKTRPDGNCFYRAFGFAHLESLLDDSKELQK